MANLGGVEPFVYDEQSVALAMMHAHGVERSGEGVLALAASKEPGGAVKAIGAAGASGGGRGKNKKGPKSPNKGPKSSKKGVAAASAGDGGGGSIPKAKVCPPGAPRPVVGTDKLYMDDTLCFAFTGAEVLDVAEAEVASMFNVTLDKTIFHPQGGGQPTDKGVIRAADDSAIFAVHMVKEDRTTGVITHTGCFTAGGVSDLKKTQQQGGLVLEIDGAWRVSCARIHSAGHALDVGMLAMGYSIRPTKGYHFPEGPYVEYEAQSPEQKLSTEEKDALPQRLTAKMEELVATALEDDEIGHFSARFLNKEETLALCEDADMSMFSAEGALVRVTRVAGGWIPCGGTHVGSVADIGRVTVTKAKAKKNTLKVSYSLEGIVLSSERDVASAKVRS